MSHEQLEEGADILLDFDKLKKVASSSHPVIPTAVQDADTKELLVIGYVSREALDYAIEHKVATFWSTSRDELWIKGKTSGDTLELVETRVNCEQNSLLYLVRPVGGGCHTKDAEGHTRKTCYYRRIADGHLEPVG